MLDSISNILTAAICDLAGTCYLFAGEVAPEVIGSSAAAQHPLLAFRFRDQLQAAGLWRGPGFAALIGNHPFQLEAAIHELAHWLTDPPFVADADALFDVAPEAIKTLATTRLWQAMPDHEPEPEPLPWLRGGTHDLQFLRAAAAVAHRVEQYGVVVSQLDVLPPHRYQLSPFADYYRALAGELSSRADEPIRSILSTSTTDAASKLWQQDVATFCERSL